MADTKLKYDTADTLTITLASLASDTSLVAGRESTVVDNATDLFVDALVGGKITTGTSPTADRQIEVWTYASYDGTTFTSGATGSDANFNPGAKEKQLMRLVEVIGTDSTSNHTYEFGPVSLASIWGGTLPQEWGIYVVHNTGVNLNSTAGNHEVKFTGIHYQSV